MSDTDKLQRLAQKIAPASKLIRTWNLEGGVSAQVTAFEMELSDGQRRKMVVRRHGDVDFGQNRHVAAHEFRLLQLLQSQDFPAPRPYYLDESGEISARPCVVIEYVEGNTDFAPANMDSYILQMASHLAKIHSIDGSSGDISFLRDQSERYAEMFEERPARLDESIGEGRIRDILESVWPLPQRNKPVLLHEDYWPGNILWKDGKLTAVIDWEDAKIGDPITDLANTRMELAMAFGIEAMEAFTGQYQSMAAIDFTDLPYWDLFAALGPAHKISEWAEDDAAERRMREGHRLFVEQAFDRLPQM